MDHEKKNKKDTDREPMTFMVDKIHAGWIAEMKVFYNLEDSDDLFSLMIRKHYEDYILEKDDEKGSDEVITDLQNRLGKLEDKFSKIYEPIQQPAKQKSSSAKKKTYR